MSARTAREAAPLAEVGTLDALAASFRRALRASNRSPRTLTAYLIGVDQFRGYLEENGLPTEAGAIKRDHVTGFIGSLFDRGLKPATAATRFRALQAFFKWAQAEGEFAQDPMVGLTPPSIPEQPVAMPSDEDVKLLLGALGGTAFLDRRDRALVLLMVDTGLRRGEIAALHVEDVDLEQNLLRVQHAKGGTPRVVPFGSQAALAVDRYVRARARHKLAQRPEFWLTMSAPLKAESIVVILATRSRAAGIDPIHPHQLRHFSVHHFLAGGGSESAAQRLFGWRSPQMLMRYAAARGVERAIAEHRRLGIADRL